MYLYKVTDALLISAIKGFGIKLLVVKYSSVFSLEQTVQDSTIIKLCTGPVLADCRMASIVHVIYAKN